MSNSAFNQKAGLNKVYTDTTITGDGTAASNLGVASLSWIGLVSSWTTEPSAVTYSGGDGDVYLYTYGSTIYYRFVPSVYDATQDIFYDTFSDPTLSNVIATRGNSI